MSSPADPHKPVSAQERLATLRKAYQKALGRHPTVIERQLMHRAATLTVRAEIAASDININANDVVRLDRAAQRAREQMFQAFVKPKPKLDMQSIEAELRGAAHG